MVKEKGGCIPTFFFGTCLILFSFFFPSPLHIICVAFYSASPRNSWREHHHQQDDRQHHSITHGFLDVVGHLSQTSSFVFFFSSSMLGELAFCSVSLFKLSKSRTPSMPPGRDFSKGGRLRFRLFLFWRFVAFTSYSILIASERARWQHKPVIEIGIWSIHS